MAEDLLYKKFPTFSVHFDECFGVLSSTTAQDPYDTESSKAQTDETQQQIHSHLKKVHVSKFPVVSNEAIQDLYSVAVVKHMQSFDPLNKTVNERTSSEAGASPDPAISNYQ